MVYTKYHSTIFGRWSTTMVMTIHLSGVDCVYILLFQNDTVESLVSDIMYQFWIGLPRRDWCTNAVAKNQRAITFWFPVYRWWCGAVQNVHHRHLKTHQVVQEIQTTGYLITRNIIARAHDGSIDKWRRRSQSSLQEWKINYKRDFHIYIFFC